MKTFLFLAILFSSIKLLAQSDPNRLTITHLTGGIYVYTTYHISGTVSTPSNSLYLVTDKQVVLFDTPWDETQFQPLLDSIEQKHHKPVVMCLVTHYHADRTAGLQYYKGKFISTWSSQLTHIVSGQRNFNQALQFFVSDTLFTIDNYSFQTYYPGPGHTEDNIVIWFPEDKVLYGGCLVKSGDYKTLGYAPDSNLESWEVSIRNVIKQFPDPLFVIPGHFNWGDKDALAHTIKLVKQRRKQKEKY